MKAKFISLVLAMAAGTIMAQAGNVAKANSAITIDGNFSDWEALTNVAHCVKSVNSTYAYLYDAKFVRDNDYIYFYLEFDAAEDDFDTGEETVHGYYVNFVHFFLNCGDESTGCSVSWFFDDPAIDLLIEGKWTDLFKTAAVMSCPEIYNGTENSEYSWNDKGVSNSTMCCNAVQLANNHMAIEGTISIHKLPVQPTEVLKVGVATSDAGWNESGALPETLRDSETGKEISGKMIIVPLLNGGSTDLTSETAAQAKPVRKLLRNGELLILRGNHTYTSTGQEVK